MSLWSDEKLTFASLFSGCGGFDLGFQNAGFECIGAFDNDKTAVAVHHRNLKSPAFVYDLSNGLWGMPFHFRPTVLLSGSPCQGFSTLGLRKIDDPRNSLLLVAGKIALQIKPSVFVAENVAGVASGDHGIYWRSLIAMLRQGGYQTVDLLCDANQMGVAQLRRRRVLVAWNNGIQVQPVFEVQPPKNLRDVLGDMEGTEHHFVIPLADDGNAAQIARRIGPGQKLSNVRSGPNAVHTWHIPEVFGHTNESERAMLELLLKLRRRYRTRNFGDADPVARHILEAEFSDSIDPTLNGLIEKKYVRHMPNNCVDLVHTFNGKYKRLRWDQPSPTVDTRFGSPRYFLHPEEDRGFTVREAARIQGFPDSFAFSGSPATQLKHIGNAVPPPVANLLAWFVRRGIFSR